MKVFLAILLFTANAWAGSVHTVQLGKQFTGPVSATEALAELEAQAKAAIIDTCRVTDEHPYVKKFIPSIPFDTSDFKFNQAGEPGSLTNPVFVYYSYPTVTAELEFFCP